MAVTRSGARGVRPRAILAGGLLALAALMQLPASAAEQPNLTSTSVDGGWSNGQTALARLDRAMKCTTNVADNKAGALCEATLSQVTIRDAAGVVQSGETRLAYAEEFITTDVLVWRFKKPDGSNDVRLRNGTYTMSIRAVPLTGDPKDFGPLTFKVDGNNPTPVFIASPQDESIIQESGAVAFTGALSDTKDRRDATSEFMSGVVKVELQFFNALDRSSYYFAHGINTNDPAQSRGPQFGQREIQSLHKVVAVTPCSLTVEYCTTVDGNGQQILKYTHKFETNVTLGTGLWTVKAIGYDKAGNGSVYSQVTFLKLQ